MPSPFLERRTVHQLSAAALQLGRTHSRLALSAIVEGCLFSDQDQRLTPMQITDPSSRQRGCRTSRTKKFPIKRTKGRICSWAPHEGQKHRQTGLLTVGCNVTLTGTNGTEITPFVTSLYDHSADTVQLFSIGATVTCCSRCLAVA
jgi:hypothetical protein